MSEAITPAAQLQDALRKEYEKLAALCDQLEADHDAVESNEKLLQIHSLLESALGTRVEIEFRRTPEAIRHLDFFEKIGTLADRGIDVRSETWNALVYVRSMVAHATKNELWIVGSLLNVLRHSDKKGTPEEKDEERLKRALHRFKELMRRLCFEHETPLRVIFER